MVSALRSNPFSASLPINGRPIQLALQVFLSIHPISGILNTHRTPQVSARTFSSASTYSYNRNFHRAIAEACKKKGITYTTQPTDTWAGYLELKGIRKPVVGFDIGLNSSTAAAASNDKTLGSFLLREKRVPNIEHQVFSELGSVREFFDKHQQNVVCKPNNGTCGKDVQHVQSAPGNYETIDRVAKQFFRMQGSICLSPYQKIYEEYRLIMLDGKVEIAFSKQRPHVIGDGKCTVLELIQNQHQNPQSLIDQLEYELGDQIPLNGQKVLLTWKHNLVNGATANLSIEPEALKQLEVIGQKAMAAIGSRLASVDIVKTEQGFFVLEINNGIMTEYLINQFGDPMFERVKNIFDRALSQLFNL